MEVLMTICANDFPWGTSISIEDSHAMVHWATVRRDSENFLVIHCTVMPVRTSPWFNLVSPFKVNCLTCISRYP
jgi:hypothetical protein